MMRASLPIVVLAAGPVGVARASEPACADGRIEIVGTLEAPWRGEAERICESLPRLPDLDPTARVSIVAGDPVVVVVVVGDGRSTTRQVTSAIHLRATVEARVTLPPSLAAPARETPAPADPPAGSPSRPARRTSAAIVTDPIPPPSPPVEPPPPAIGFEIGTPLSFCVFAGAEGWDASVSLPGTATSRDRRAIAISGFVSGTLVAAAWFDWCMANVAMRTQRRSFSRFTTLVTSILAATVVFACGDDDTSQGGAASTTGAAGTTAGPSGSGAKSGTSGSGVTAASGSTTTGPDGSASASTATGMAQPGSGLDFPTNHQPGSDARLVWSGSDMVSRTSHTVVWQARFAQQSGYHAVAWHTSNDGTWHASLFEYGTHPYPTTGTVNADGQSTGGTGGRGTVHFYEIAGLGASDFIASPGPGPTYEVQKDVWVMQARVAETVGNDVHHRYWPDLANPGAFIEQIQPRDGIDDAEAAAVDPAFTIGGSPWTGDGVGNGESPGGVIRNLMIFDAPLDVDDIVAEASGLQSAPETAAGAASVWYINRDPTPEDVDDKSGEGHSPVWANEARPGVYLP